MEFKLFWLTLERYENWKVDKASNFKFLGISERKLKLASEMKPGDYILNYVSSGYSSFTDVRKVVSDKPVRSKTKLVYDEPFPYQITTELYIGLEEKNWLKVHDFIGKLSFLPINKDWRQIFRNSLRKIENDDAQIIINAIKSACET